MTMIRCTHPHHCPEWDYMFITPLMPEFDCCTCECDGVMPTFHSYLQFVNPKVGPNEIVLLKKWFEHRQQHNDFETCAHGYVSDKSCLQCAVKIKKQEFGEPWRRILDVRARPGKKLLIVELWDTTHPECPVQDVDQNEDFRCGYCSRPVKGYYIYCSLECTEAGEKENGE